MAEHILTATDADLIALMQLLGDHTRYRIFRMLSSDEQLCVSEIAERLSITVSAVSQHLRGFEAANIVEKERFGQKVCYSMKDNNEFVAHLHKLMKED